MTVNLVLASPSMAIICYFANIYRILVKVEQRFFHRQMTLGHIRLLTASCEGGLSNTCGRQGENAKRLPPADQETPVVRVRVESGGIVWKRMASSVI